MQWFILKLLSPASACLGSPNDNDNLWVRDGSILETDLLKLCISIFLIKDFYFMYTSVLLSYMLSIHTLCIRMCVCVHVRVCLCLVLAAIRRCQIPSKQLLHVLLYFYRLNWLFRFCLFLFCSYVSKT